MWCGRDTDRVFRCFDNPKVLSCVDLLVGVVLELSSLLTV
jgi:hypothetical protein